MSNFKILNKASIDDAKKIMKDKNASANEKWEKIVDCTLKKYSHDANQSLLSPKGNNP